ncbi:DUF2141 domain-containing protein [Erythrobacteraceae bacterium CFH 75059]|nr:DUF2141 domain-containing protein [Erythrobacteraceae bacterium CFH 75059]
MAGSGRVEVAVSDLRSARGSVMACLTGDPVTFPRCNDDPNAQRLVVPAGRGHALVFRNVAPGRYAVALLHDENGNGRADRSLGMIPREGFGFSRDAPVRMGPPRFDDAAFTTSGGETRLAITVRYML